MWREIATNILLWVSVFMTLLHVVFFFTVDAMLGRIGVVLSLVLMLVTLMYAVDKMEGAEKHERDGC